MNEPQEDDHQNISNDDEGFSVEFENARAATIIAIDCNPTMLSPLTLDPDVSGLGTPVVSIAECFYEILRDDFFNISNDYFGIVLYNTSKRDEFGSPKGIFIWRPLELPSPSLLKSLLELSSAKKDNNGIVDTLGKIIGSVASDNDCDSVPLVELFAHCLVSINKTLPSNIKRKNLILITNSETSGTNKSAREKAITTRMRDLICAGVNIFPMFLTADGNNEKFVKSEPKISLQKFSTWYKHFTEVETSLKEFEYHKSFLSKSGDRNSGNKNLFWNQIHPTIISSTEQLSSLVQKIQTKPRETFRVPFFLTESLSCQVVGYVLIGRRPRTAVAADFVHCETERLILKRNKRICVSTGTPLDLSVDGKLDSQNKTPGITYTANWAGKTVKIMPEDRNKMSYFGSCELRLVAFAPESCVLKMRHLSIDHAIFIAAEMESNTTSASKKRFLNASSPKLINSLVNALVEAKSVAIVRSYPRRSATPRLAALLPQWESYDEQGMLYPTGFHLIPFPFVEEIRPNPEFLLNDEKENDNNCKVSEYISECLGDVCAAFVASSYDPEFFPDPVRVRFQELLHAKALGIDSGAFQKESSDTLKPDLDYWVEGGASSAAEKFLSLCAPLKITGKKSLDTRKDGTCPMEATQIYERVKNLQEAGRLHLLKVNELRIYFRSKGLASDGVKAILLDRLEKDLNKEV